MTVWTFQVCRFYLALQASQADRPQDASVTLQIRMTASCETEIVTLRGEACLVRSFLCRAALKTFSGFRTQAMIPDMDYPAYAPATRFVFLPVMVLTGLWM